MEVKAYIESGILEQYVLGKTSPEQNGEVSRMSALHPEIHEEIRAIEEALFQYAKTFATEPPPKIKEQLFSQLDLDQLLVDEEPTAAPKTISLKPPTVNEKPALIHNYFLLAASFLLLALSVVGNIWLYNQWKSSENQLATMTTDNQLLTQDLQVREANFAAVKSQLDVIQDPNMKPVVLKGMPLLPQALATIYWNTKNNDVYLNARTLPQTSETEQYQLWAIVEGKPVDAGTFVTQEALDGMVKMKNIKNASAFAVTIEKKGGSQAPTLDKMVLMGGV